MKSPDTEIDPKQQALDREAAVIAVNNLFKDDKIFKIIEENKDDLNKFIQSGMKSKARLAWMGVKIFFRHPRTCLNIYNQRKDLIKANNFRIRGDREFLTSLLKIMLKDNADIFKYIGDHGNVLKSLINTYKETDASKFLPDLSRKNLEKLKIEVEESFFLSKNELDKISSKEQLEEALLKKIQSGQKLAGNIVPLAIDLSRNKTLRKISASAIYYTIVAGDYAKKIPITEIAKGISETVSNYAKKIPVTEIAKGISETVSNYAKKIPATEIAKGISETVIGYAKKMPATEIAKGISETVSNYAKKISATEIAKGISETAVSITERLIEKVRATVKGAADDKFHDIDELASLRPASLSKESLKKENVKRPSSLDNEVFYDAIEGHVKKVVQKFDSAVKENSMKKPNIKNIDSFVKTESRKSSISEPEKELSPRNGRKPFVTEQKARRESFSEKIKDQQKDPSVARSR